MEPSLHLCNLMSFRVISCHLMSPRVISQVLNLLEKNKFPGSILVRVGLGTMQAYSANKDKWENEIQGLLRREPIRVSRV